ncbi:hypothetical protein [Mariprofundus sp. EBB-1]|nr:hypothetical protein [Mariprofundus sp. EBB-1]
MITELANSESARMEFIKWVSLHNAHVPLPEIEFLIGHSPNDENEERL